MRATDEITFPHQNVAEIIFFSGLFALAVWFYIVAWSYKKNEQNNPAPNQYFGPSPFLIPLMGTGIFFLLFGICFVLFLPNFPPSGNAVLDHRRIILGWLLRILMTVAAIGTSYFMIWRCNRWRRQSLEIDAQGLILHRNANQLRWLWTDITDLKINRSLGTIQITANNGRVQLPIPSHMAAFGEAILSRVQLEQAIKLENHSFGFKWYRVFAVIAQIVLPAVFIYLSHGNRGGFYFAGLITIYLGALFIIYGKNVFWLSLTEKTMCLRSLRQDSEIPYSEILEVHLKGYGLGIWTSITLRSGQLHKVTSRTADPFSLVREIKSRL